MTPKEFVGANKPYALETQNKTGISAVAILTQAALESGWGKYAPGNMFFGVKDTDGVNGNEQLINTTEYFKSATLTPKQVGLVSISSITPVMIKGVKFFKYSGKAYFRKYNTPADSFYDHTQFFFKNSRYKEALKVCGDANKFFDAIAKAGYATDPSYATTLKSVARIIEKFM